MLLLLVSLVLLVFVTSAAPNDIPNQNGLRPPTHCPAESFGQLPLTYEEPIDGIRSYGSVVLVAQRSEISIFGHSASIPPQMVKIGSFPGTPDDSGYLRGAELVNENSFVYCGRRKCR